jgi:hypothetical protein
VSETAAILAELSSRGVTVRADGKTLRLSPRAVLDDRLLARVQAHKPEILAILSGRSPTRRCVVCRSYLFWRSIHGAMVCVNWNLPSTRLVCTTHTFRRSARTSGN